MERIRLLLHYIRRHTLSYTFGVIFIIATNWIAVTIPEYIQKSIDLLSVGFQVTEEVLTQVRSDIVQQQLPISTDTVDQLTPLLGQHFPSEAKLLETAREKLGEAATSTLEPLLVKHAYLSEQLESNESLLEEYLLIMLVLAITMIGVRTVSRVLFFTPGRAIECEVKNDTFAKLTLLQKDYHDENPTGKIISKMNNDVNGIRLLCGFGLMQIVNILSALSLTPFKMWQLSPILTVYCVIPIILVFVVVRVGMRLMVRNMRARQEELQNMSTFVVSSLSGIDVIKSFGMNAWVRRKFDIDNQKLRDRSLKISFIRAFFMPLLNNMENVLKVLILLVGGMFVIQQEFTIGELTAFITYAALLTMPLMALGWVTTMAQQGMVGLDSVNTILKQKPPFQDREPLPKSEAIHLFDQGISVRNLTFQYPEQKEPTLRDINFTIRPGQTIGILGQIGCGKSTLVNCLNRYLPVEDNMIFYGNRDINQLTYSNIRQSVRTVTQSPFLFSDSVEKNIIFGCPGADEECVADLNQILYECAMQDEVRRFANQEQTVVGEKGIMLSGGQKQRISLGRAMIAPCDLLILDNVLSAVDYDTERFLLKQILRRKHARSLLIVSHRANALEHADLILVLKNGRIVDQGTHAELVERPGYYQETWKLQNEMQEEVA